jgi:hypothetical protein
MVSTPCESDQFTYESKLWQRGENSYATTVPQGLLAVRGAPVENGKVEWSIDQESGNVVAEFKERDLDE